MTDRPAPTTGPAARPEPTSRRASGAVPMPGPEVLDIRGLRTQVRESFGQVMMAIMNLPRYRYQSLGDLTQMVLQPLIRDRIAIARPAKEEPGMLTDISGFAICASVSEEVDGKIRDQIKAGTFPVRLKPEDWPSGSINWLLDVIAPGLPRRLAQPLKHRAPHLGYRNMGRRPIDTVMSFVRQEG